MLKLVLGSVLDAVVGVAGIVSVFILWKKRIKEIRSAADKDKNN